MFCFYFYNIQDGNSALMMAAKKGCRNVCALLIEHGADIDLLNKVFCAVIFIVMYTLFSRFAA